MIIQQEAGIEMREMDEYKNLSTTSKKTSEKKETIKKAIE